MNKNKNKSVYDLLKKWSVVIRAGRQYGKSLILSKGAQTGSHSVSFKTVKNKFKKPSPAPTSDPCRLSLKS